MSYPINDIVKKIGTIAIEGNLIPHHWFQALTFDSGKSNFVAVILLSEILYWYRPTYAKCENTGKPLPPTKRFKSDFLQRSTRSFAEQFGFSTKQTRDALRFLEDLGLIIRHYRTIDYGEGQVCSNVQYVELVPIAIKKLQECTSGRFQKIHTYGPARPDPLPPTSTGVDLQGGTYTETTTETTTEITKDSVGTLPFSQKEGPNQPEEKNQHPIPKRPPDPNRFVKKLNPEQRQLHDMLIKYVPENGEPLRSEDVTAWMTKQNPFTVKQIRDAFQVYRQDVEEAKARGEVVRSMGGCMRQALNNGRRPKNVDMDLNKAMANRAAMQHKFVELTVRYVKVHIGNCIEEIEFNMPRREFHSQLEKKVNLARCM